MIGVLPAPLSALVGRHQLQLAQLVAQARVGQRLDREHHLQVGRVGDGVVQADGGVARRDQPVARLPRGGADGNARRVRHCCLRALRARPTRGEPAGWPGAGSRLAAALRIEVLAHDVQIGHLAAEHALQRRLPAEERRAVRPAHPLIGALALAATAAAAPHRCRTGTTAAPARAGRAGRPCPASTGTARCGPRPAAPSVPRA